MWNSMYCEDTKPVRRTHFWGSIAGPAAGFLLLFPISPQTHQESAPVVLRIGLTSGAFTEIQANDGAAALRAWSEALSENLDLVQSVETVLLDGPDEVRNVLLQGDMDLIGLPTTQFLEIEELTVPDELFTIATQDGEIYERLVILVRKDSGFTSMEDLGGTHLHILSNSRTYGTAEAWIDVTLSELGLPLMREHFDDIAEAKKPSRAVLPVFFGQADACLATQSAFHTTCELNPQVGRALEVIASSAPMLPSLICFRNGVTEELRHDVYDALQRLHSNAYGKQILTTLKADRVVPMDSSCLEGVRDLVSAKERLERSAGLD